MTIYCLRPHEGPHQCACCHVTEEEWRSFQAIREVIDQRIAQSVLDAVVLEGDNP
jgi:hypothetical protein